ncbi:MAG: hypothetical protein ACFCUW_03330 [Kiloniellaceae bacterium]
MPTRFTPRAAAACAAIAVSLAAGTAAAYECEQQVERALSDAAVQQADVTSVKVVRRSFGPNPSSNYTLDAWVRLGSCSAGAVVVHMTRYCMVQETYTTGNCSIPGVPHY